jgi:hypothetical protein
MDNLKDYAYLLVIIILCVTFYLFRGGNKSRVEIYRDRASVVQNLVASVEVSGDVGEVLEAVESSSYNYVNDELETKVELVAKVPRNPHKFRKWLVQQGKAKFGMMSVSESNRLVVRKFLYDICREQKLRARHICDHLDIAVALVLIPDDQQLVAKALYSTLHTKEQMADSESLGDPLRR